MTDSVVWLPTNSAGSASAGSRRRRRLVVTIAGGRIARSIAAHAGRRPAKRRADGTARGAGRRASATIRGGSSSSRSLLVFVFLIVLTLFNIWFERRVVARMQQRLGPNVPARSACCSRWPTASS